jgi:hypothetical protein
MYRLDVGVIGSGMGAFPVCGPLAKDSAAKLKRSQLNVCTVYCCSAWTRQNRVTWKTLS